MPLFTHAVTPRRSQAITPGPARRGGVRPAWSRGRRRSRPRCRQRRRRRRPRLRLRRRRSFRRTRSVRRLRRRRRRCSRHRRSRLAPPPLSPAAAAAAPRTVSRLSPLPVQPPPQRRDGPLLRAERRHHHRAPPERSYPQGTPRVRELHFRRHVGFGVCRNAKDDERCHGDHRDLRRRCCHLRAGQTLRRLILQHGRRAVGAADAVRYRGRRDGCGPRICIHRTAAAWERRRRPCEPRVSGVALRASAPRTRHRITDMAAIIAAAHRPLVARAAP